jgi:UDP-N-acetylmuramoyl-L-alanyl-D-glutamate--2,6-diaminopimelate ligase
MISADSINTNLTELFKGLSSKQIVSENIHVSSISLDSRTVMDGGLFLLLAKDSVQRLQFLQQGIEKGAAVIAYDSEYALSADEQELCTQKNISAYAIDNLSDNTGEIAARFYGHPSKTLTIIAITGTNGKTSVSQFIGQALEFLHIPCGVIGTLGVGRITNLKSTGMTTPDPVKLQSVLAAFKKQAINYVVIEASSHALEQGRLNSVDIDIAVLTNLSRDHLDYHPTMDSYARAKQRLFEFASINTAVINIDDAFGQSLAKQLDKTAVNLLSYSSQENIQKNVDMHIQAIAISTKPEGLSFILQNNLSGVDINSSLVGRFNVDNLLAATLVLLAVDIEFKQAIEAITHCHAVEGRMEVYGGKNQVQVIIDFAHTPDALTQALTSLKSHLTAKGQLWCVFGCGGDRDKGKRALMGTSAVTHADKLVITADNPRSESNDAIVEEILTGIDSMSNVHIEHDRQKAIIHAITAATNNDIVLVAGKGHEQYQEILGIKHPFSDAQVVTKALAAANDAQHVTARVKQ